MDENCEVIATCGRLVEYHAASTIRSQAVTATMAASSLRLDSLTTCSLRRPNIRQIRHALARMGDSNKVKPSWMHQLKALHEKELGGSTRKMMALNTCSRPMNDAKISKGAAERNTAC